LYRDNYIKEEISEKIRLLYVSLTRCREKMIVVAPIQNKTITNLDERYNYKSFLDILNSVYDNISSYITNIDYSEILTHDYDLIKEINYKIKMNKTDEIVDKKEIIIGNEFVTTKKYSKDDIKLMNDDIRKNIEFGKRLHYIFELFDFKNPNYDSIDESYGGYIKNFLDSGIDFKNAKIYKEFEFYDTKNNSHGIIDLMLEYDKDIIIVDYKLKNILDSEYVNQLNGYKKYIETKTNKCVKIYLYSIINGELKELKG
jgi:ATP-dependent exoDNAse (exonuclease V) beta subunit